MAMASFEDSNNEYYRIMKEQVIRFTKEGCYELDLSFFKGYIHEQPCLYTDKLVKLFGLPRRYGEKLEKRHFKIASALQRISEDAAVHLLTWIYNQTKEENIVLSGGFFMNSVFNGKVLKFEKSGHKEIDLSEMSEHLSM